MYQGFGSIDYFSASMKKSSKEIKTYQLDASLYRMHKDSVVPSDFGLKPEQPDATFIFGQFHCLGI